MQVFKRVNKKVKRAQNLIEFVFVFPLLIFMVLVMFEVALFWQDVNSIYNLNAEINANVANLNYSPVYNSGTGTYTGMTMGSTCPAATTALSILQAKDSSITENNPTYQTQIVYGAQPFALYRYYGGNNITATNGEVSPQVQLWVDCRNPFENGITTQLEFYHKTLVINATIPSFSGGPGIEVIPKNIFIASPKLNTVRHY